MIARYSRGKILATLIGAIVFVGLGAWLFVSPEFGDKAKLAGMASVLFFGLVAVVAARALFDKRPVLTIDETQVFDRRSMDRPIPWTEVAGIAETSINGKAFYYLDIGDPVDRFTTGRYKRWLLNANQGFGRGVTVSPHSLNASPATVRDALLSHAPTP